MILARLLMARLAGYLVLVALAFGGAFPSPARADDIRAAGRGVVRVVTIAVVDDEVVGFGHGSGFAVAPDRIVTNAHVVELAARYPDNVVIGIVPSEGDKSFQGRVVAIDPGRDLALISFRGAKLPPLALFGGAVEEGGQVTALGYPGNVDLATARSAADYIKPLTPIRSEGVFSGRRSLSGVDVMLHTANIARGNSGGPLLDPCGRVIGVNSAITRGDQGDASFAFAIAAAELSGFLAEAKQAMPTVALPCTSIAERLRLDSEAEAKMAQDRISAADAAAADVTKQREAALAKAKLAADRARENYIAVAAVLLVLGALAAGGAGLLELRGERRYAIIAVSGGGVLLVAAIAVFLLRPTGDLTLPPPMPTPAPVVSSDAALGKLVCTFVPERSRVTVSDTKDVALDWGQGGCMNERTQYAENGSKWDRILVPNEELSVSVLQFDPAARIYTNTRWLLTEREMESLRKIRSQITLKTCSQDVGARANLSTQQSAIRAALPPFPNEKIVYSCKPAP